MNGTERTPWTLLLLHYDPALYSQSNTDSLILPLRVAATLDQALVAQKHEHRIKWP